MIKQLEVDGVPTLLAPTTGPMHAGLVFRVGQADETLARKGVTHLIEHLALHSIGVADYHYNGVTGVEHTYFHMQGTATEITDFLTGVCTALGSLPMARLTTEKEILRTERMSRGNPAGELLGLWRHGARDFGLLSYPEWGLTGLTAEDLREWVARYFTRDNAALWIAGDEIPAGLTLALPAGTRRPAPRASSALPVTPAWFGGSSGVVAWDSVVRRGAAAMLFTHILERRMFRELRQEAGLSYSLGADYQTRQDGTAVITAVADALPEKQGAVLGGFVDLLAALRVGRIDPDEVTAVAQHATEALRRAEEQGGHLPGQAFKLLAGLEVREPADTTAEIRAVTRDAVTEVAAEAYAAGLLMTPGGTSADWAGYTDAPTTSDHAVEGRRFPAVNDPGHHLVAGPDGVSKITGDDIATVRYDACAAVLAWPDGRRQLIGLDAMLVAIEPTLHADGFAAVSEIDARIPPDHRIDMPARDAADIPQPPLISRRGRWQALWWKITTWLHTHGS
ncbi:insulinase family protein [Actinoplanes sp. NPDC049316]|uniref:M16 family metallopeptidase n=1 Tax=Actinoplanes sp. NPDC049316 TaxID=3154727 RepID=UPI00342C3B0D